MKRIALGLAAVAIGALAAPGEASASIAAFTGNWVNVNAATSGVTRIRILRTGPLVRVNAFGQCHPNDCNWGLVAAQVYGASVAANALATTRTLLAAFPSGFARRVMIIERAGANRLRVSVLTRFTDGSGRRPYSTIALFRRAAAAPPGPPAAPAPGPGSGPVVVREDCVRFNPATTVMRRVGANFTLVDRGHAIKSFGVKAVEAVRALRIVRAYRLNRICFVGRPNPSMEYFKRGALLPVGNLPGQDCLSINPAAMAIRHIGARYTLAQGNHLVMSFPNLVEARLGLAIMRRLNARHSCFVGRPGPSMTYLRR